MSNKKLVQRSPDHANAQLDALLQKGVQADQRATRPSIPTPTQPVANAIASPTERPPTAIPHLERLTVRFTQSEARLLEKARGVARSMGYKMSDTAVFRLALNALRDEQMTPQAIEAVLLADGRRRQG